METGKKNFRVIPEKQTCLRRLQVLRSHVDPVFDCHENILLMGCSVGCRVLCCIARAIGTSSAADHELQSHLAVLYTVALYQQRYATYCALSPLTSSSVWMGIPPFVVGTPLESYSSEHRTYTKADQ